jgi:hypothetical protein
LGRQANHIPISQPGDNVKTCDQLAGEALIASSKAQALENKCNNKKVSNIVCAIAGWFVIIPWFFMDLKLAECEEAGDWQARADYLDMMVSQQNCN